MRIRTFVVDTAKFVMLLLLGTACTVLSIVCLPSLGFGITLLSEQAATWFRTSQWNPVTLAALLKEVGCAPHVDWPWIQSAIERLLSLESGPILIAAAASVWGIALIMFDQVLKKWHPDARVF